MQRFNKTIIKKLGKAKGKSLEIQLSSNTEQ